MPSWPSFQKSKFRQPSGSQKPTAGLHCFASASRSAFVADICTPAAGAAGLAALGSSQLVRL